VIENIYNAYFKKYTNIAHQIPKKASEGDLDLSEVRVSQEVTTDSYKGDYVVLKEIIEFFHGQLDIEDVICFMANVYPNKPYLRDTILFDVLKLFKPTRADWSLVKAHFKVDCDVRQPLRFALLRPGRVRST
jgi:hypothetical protein